MQAGNGAELFVESLLANGIDRLFLNPGIDTVPLQGAIARFKALGKKAPQVILCPHESVAVAAAHGYAMVTGKPQVVAVFQDVGTLQGGGAIVNLLYGRIPVILCAGKNEAPQRVNWLKEPFDQRKIVRDYVKWDHEVHIDEDISSVLQEAFRIASTEPCGPVYLSIPREVLTGGGGKQRISAPFKFPTPSKMDKVNLRRAVETLIQSENPLILTAYLGRHPQSVASLTNLAEMMGARVIPTDLRMNFPSTHPLCPGMDAIAGNDYDHYIAEADLLLLIDYDFPGPMEKQVKPRPDAKIIHIDIEPLKRGKPLWDRTPDLLFEGNSSEILPALNKELMLSLNHQTRKRFQDRFKRLEKEHQQLKEVWRMKAQSQASQEPISAEWLCHCINEVLDEEAILVHMIPSSAEAFAHQIQRTNPGTLFSWGDRAGSMGWPLGAALGAKLAAPDHLVVSLIGDGGFIYGCPVATLWSADVYQAPFLTIIFNNQSYASIKALMRMWYGENSVSGEKGFEFGTDLKKTPDFALIAKACRAYGQTVEDPSELVPVLKGALTQVLKGRAAVVDVRI